MDLQEPTRKMSKSASARRSAPMLVLEDPPEEIERKVRRAVTDTETEVRYDPVNKPGVSNLLELLAAGAGGDPAGLAGRYSNYGPLKADVTEALIELLRPVRERYAELHADRGHVESVLAQGAAKAQAVGGTHPRPGHARRGAARPAGRLQQLTARHITALA